MAVLGRVLFGSQQRVDLSDMLAIDSYVGGDIKYLIQSLTSKPMILKGFEIIDAPLSIGTTGVSIKVADSVVYSPTSTAGSFYYGLPEGNELSAALVPELRQSATNYIYLTLTTEGRAQDSRAFWDPDISGGVGGEFNQDVNTESVLKAQLGVSVSTFPEGSIPLCKVDMGPTVIVSITDCRNMMFRLGSGGLNPDPFNTYSFLPLPSASYARNETPVTITNSAAPTPFAGGDKNVYDLKGWMDLVMTKLLEISGTTFWYEATVNVSLPGLFDDALGSTIKSKGKWSHSGATPGLVTWSEDIVYKKINDLRDIIIRANPISGAQLANEQVLYIKLERDEPVNSANSAVDFIGGSLFVNGNASSFTLLAKGDWIKKQSDDASNYYRVEETYSAQNGGGTAAVASSVALSIRLSAAYVGVTETSVAQRTKGEFKQSPAQYSIANRNDPALFAAGGNAYWLALRSDTILNIGSIDTVYFGSSVNVSDSDGVRAKLTFPSAHSLADGERIIVSGAGLYNGTYEVEVATATAVFIATTQTANPSGITASWAVVTTAARTNGFGFNLESADHGFASGESLLISGTATPYDTYQNGLYTLAVRSATVVQIPYDANTPDIGAVGQAAVARVILRTEFGSISVVQGQDVDIGGDIQNILDYIGMESLAQTSPDYQIPGDGAGQTLLFGSQSYNADENDSLTKRVSRLTGMMMGRVQDRGLGLNGRLTLRNEAGGANQIVAASGSLEISKPGSPSQVVAMPASFSLPANTALVAVIDREGGLAITPTVESLGSPFLIAENKLILVSRFSSTSVFSWDGSEIVNSSSYTIGQLEDSQSKNVSVHDQSGVRLDPTTGILSYANTISDVTIIIPGSSANTIDTASLMVLSGAQRTIASGSCAWIRINRRAAKVFTTTSFVATAQDSDVAGIVYITPLAAVPIDQDVFVVYINRSGALLQPQAVQPSGNVYEEDKIVVAGSPIDDNEVTGPIPSTTIISLPLDSRNFDDSQFYVVGSGQLELYLNGQKIRLGNDWFEVGATGASSNQIEIQQDLVVGDFLTFRIGTTGAVYFTPSPPSGASLQTAYDNGSIINVNTGTPVTINGSGGKLFVVNGDVEITGVIDPKGIEFTRESSDPLAAGSDGIWIDGAGHMIHKRGASPSIDVTESITNPSSFITAGAALGFTGSVLDVKLDSASGLAVVLDQVTVVKDAAGAIIGDSATGIRVALEPSNASLEIASNQLRLKHTSASGLAVDASGVSVNLEAASPSLQILGNELGIKLDASGSIVKAASGIKVNLETADPSLQIVANKLGAKLDGTRAITKTAAGLGININSSLQIVGNILGVANVGTVLIDLENNTGSTVSAGTAVAADTVAGKFILAGAGSLGAGQRYVGVAAASIPSATIGKIQVAGRSSIPAATFVAGQPVYLSTVDGQLTPAAPSSTGAAILMVGVAVSTTEMIQSTYLIGIKGNVYEESMLLVAPALSGSNLTLPADSRDAASAQNYRVNSGDLEVLLNGQKLRVSDDYTEIGTPGTFSVQIQVQQDLFAGDLVTFRVAPTQTSLGGGNLTDPMISAGDMVYRNSLNATDRLAAGTSGQVLTVTAPGTLAWAANPAGFSDPTTIAGDLIYKNSGGTTTRLPAGVPGQVLSVVNATTVAWSSPTAVVQEIGLANESGGSFPAFTPIRVNASGIMAEIDVSIEAQASAIVGLTKVVVPNNTTGSIVTSGRLENISNSFAFGSVLYVSKLGGLTDIKPTVGTDGFVSGDMAIKIGVVTRNQIVVTNRDLILQVQLIGVL